MVIGAWALPACGDDEPPADSGVMDAAVDSGPLDTGAPDTAADTGAADAGTPDGSGDAGSDAACLEALEPCRGGTCCDGLRCICAGAMCGCVET